MQTRSRFVAILLLSVFLLVIGRLFYWQVIKADDLAEQARKQHTKANILSAPRGNILASDGSWLAGRVDGWLLYGLPKEIEDDPKNIANKIASLIVDDQEDRQLLLSEIDNLQRTLGNKEQSWVSLKKRLDSDTKQKIEAFEIAGLDFDHDDMRAYPEGSAAAQLLGFVGKNENGEDQGYFGLEGFYDLSLKGRSGYISRESDAKGIPIGIGDEQEVLAVSGVDLLTYIDKSVQIAVEKKLMKGITTYGAKSGSVIVMNPKDGAVIAMSSYPSYDPGNYFEYKNEDFRNPVISESFEPGSVFKIIVMAAGVDTGSVSYDTKCEICTGPFKIDKYYIGTWNDKYHPDSTMTDVIVNSDNVGMVFVSQKLGKENFLSYMKKFGLGQPTGIDLQGEMSPKLREDGDWSSVDLATASFGQGIALTPMQMIRAASVIANDGYLVNPKVVDKLIGAGWQEDVNKKENKTQVISKKSADDITAMMVEAAKNGESKWTYTRGFGVAGKTGTAQIPIAGHYDEDKTIASFIGFAPYDDPKFIMLVTLREPSTSPWASETAAPLWYDIAKDLFLYFRMTPKE